MTVIYADEVAQYIRRAVDQYATYNIPGQVIFEIQCNCNPHNNARLDIQFKLFADNQWVVGPSLEDAIAEHVRRYSIKRQLSPLMIERHPHNDPVPASVTPPATDDEIPF